MENSEHENHVVRHQVGNNIFIFDAFKIKYETYENEWYYGITFFIENDGDGLLHFRGRYDIVHHYHMDWERLVINNKEGCKDLPFHSGTHFFLPEGIEVQQV